MVDNISCALIESHRSWLQIAVKFWHDIRYFETENEYHSEIVIIESGDDYLSSASSAWKQLFVMGTANSR